MSFAVNTAVVNVSGSVTSTVTTYTVSVCSANWTSTAAQTLGTVGANKRWRIIGLQATNTGVASANAHELLIQLNGVTWLDATVRGIATYPTGAGMVSVAFTPEACPIITAGQTVAVPAQSATGQKGAVCYYIEEAV